MLHVLRMPSSAADSESASRSGRLTLPDLTITHFRLVPGKTSQPSGLAILIFESIQIYSNKWIEKKGRGRTSCWFFCALEFKAYYSSDNDICAAPSAHMFASCPFSSARCLNRQGAPQVCQASAISLHVEHPLLGSSRAPHGLAHSKDGTVASIRCAKENGRLKFVHWSPTPTPPFPCCVQIPFLMQFFGAHHSFRRRKLYGGREGLAGWCECDGGQHCMLPVPFLCRRAEANGGAGMVLRGWVCDMSHLASRWHLSSPECRPHVLRVVCGNTIGTDMKTSTRLLDHKDPLSIERIVGLFATQLPLPPCKPTTLP